MHADQESTPVVVVVANSFELGKCRGCGAPLSWAITYPMRKRLPLTAPARIVRRDTADDGTRLAYVDRAAVHFVTCPKAKQFRGGRA